MEGMISRRRRSAALLLAALVSSGAAPGAQTTISIANAPAPAAPRLQPPYTFAAFPGTQLVFAIPTTGQAPLTYTASNLPAGLALGADTGIISGTMPPAGAYPVSVTVTNAVGNATVRLILVSGNTLSLTPPAGWNSYDSFGASVTESEVLEQARALKTLLQPFGWNYVVIDYRWYEPGQPIDTNGRYLPATNKYPSATGSNGFKSLAEKVHAMGLAFGIHIMRGIPRKSYDANTPISNSTYRARDAGNPNDPCPWDQHMWGVRGDTPAGQAWYDSIFKQYADWGVDFIKVDDMVNNDTRTYHEAEVNAIAKAIRNSGRSMVLSLSHGPMMTANAAHLNTNANMWRIVNDFWDYNGLSTLSDVFTTAGNWQTVSSLTAGHWPDGDMLPLGYLGPRNEWHASGQTTFSKNEQVTIMSLWSIMPSPLMFGGNVVSLGSDEWTRNLLSNEEVMAVNQDSSGTHGKRILQQGSTEVWIRELTGGRRAVALFNRGTEDATVSATFAQIGVAGTPTIRDLWHRADVSGMTTALSVNVPHKGALMYTLTPPGAAAGGAPSSGGTTSTGGSTNQGGTVSISGGRNSSGGSASGGSMTGGRANGGSASGGKAMAGGVENNAGASTTSAGSQSNAGATNGDTSTGGSKPVGGQSSGSSSGTPSGGAHLLGGASNGGAMASVGGASSVMSAGTAATGIPTAPNGDDVGACSCRVQRRGSTGLAWAALLALSFARRGRWRRANRVAAVHPR